MADDSTRLPKGINQMEKKKNPTLIRFVYKAIATGKLQHKYAMNEADEK